MSERLAPLLTIAAAADELGLDAKDLRNRVRRNDIPCVKLGGSMLRFRKEAVQQYKETLVLRANDDVAAALHLAREMKRLGKPPRRTTDLYEVDENGNPVMLYFFHNPITQMIKIGVSIEVEKRMAALEAACGCELTLLGFHYGGRKTEAALHRYFKKRRTKGEWFLECDAIFKIADAVHKEGVCAPLNRRRIRVSAS